MDVGRGEIILNLIRQCVNANQTIRLFVQLLQNDTKMVLTSNASNARIVSVIRIGGT